LLVYLVAPNQPETTLLGRGVPDTALFAMLGDKAELAPGLVRYDGRTVEIDVTSLPTNGPVDLKFQLVNTDNDLGSQFVARSFSVESVAIGHSFGPLAMNATTVAPGGPIDTGLMNLTQQMEIEFASPRFSFSNNTYTVELMGQATASGLGRQVIVVFPNLPDGITLENASGTTADGKPYVNMQPAIPFGGLQPQARSLPNPLQFHNSRQFALRVTPQVLVGPGNRPPEFAPLPALNIVPGGILETQLSAIDPDGDRVQFCIRSDHPLPHGRLSSDGVLHFLPSPDEIGQYPLTLMTEFCRPLTT